VVIRLLRNTGLDRDLRLGIRRDELALEYQPIIDLDSGRCVAAEALLRWRHPVHGNVRLDLFIPLAEDTGLIGPLTEWVVRVMIDYLSGSAPAETSPAIAPITAVECFAGVCRPTEEHRIETLYAGDCSTEWIWRSPVSAAAIAANGGIAMACRSRTR
jgi:hypothetical protein